MIGILSDGLLPFSEYVLRLLISFASLSRFEISLLASKFLIWPSILFILASTHVILSLIPLSSSSAFCTLSEEVLFFPFSICPFAFPSDFHWFHFVDSFPSIKSWTFSTFHVWGSLINTWFFHVHLHISNVQLFNFCSYFAQNHGLATLKASIIQIIWHRSCWVGHEGALEVSTSHVSGFMTSCQKTKFIHCSAQNMATVSEMSHSVHIHL